MADKAMPCALAGFIAALRKVDTMTDHETNPQNTHVARGLNPFTLMAYQMDPPKMNPTSLMAAQLGSLHNPIPIFLLSPFPGISGRCS